MGFQDPLVADLVIAIDSAEDVLARIGVPDGDGYRTAHGERAILAAGNGPWKSLDRAANRECQ